MLSLLQRSLFVLLCFLIVTGAQAAPFLLHVKIDDPSRKWVTLVTMGKIRIPAPFTATPVITKSTDDVVLTVKADKDGTHFDHITCIRPLGDPAPLIVHITCPGLCEKDTDVKCSAEYGSR